MEKNYIFMGITLLFILLTSCERREIELSGLEHETQLAINDVTLYKPGPREYSNGKVGGTYTLTLLNDPKTFNTLTARDQSSRTLVDSLFSFLLNYDPYTREFTPEAAASYRIETNETEGTLIVHFTLRNDLYWSSPDAGIIAQVTADDVVFWYNEIDGDIELQQPGYASQFLDMPDGSKKRITIRKHSSLSFSFTYPRIIANPLLSSNMSFGPRYMYEPVKKKGGVTALRNLLNISTDVRSIPSMGPRYITEYAPGKYAKLERNPYYWKKDDNNTVIPYIETFIYRIVPNINASFLMFQEGESDSYVPRAEDLNVLIQKENPDYDVYNGGSSLSSDFILFNQNPNTVPQPKLSWFTNRKFRQAMSSLLNRKRIATQVYRGLAEPALHFFARPNPYFDPEISLQFTYNPENALALLAEMGITPGKESKLYDDQGNHIEFDIMVNAENDIRIAIVNIFVDELRKAGITARLITIDFQSLVDRITESYEWDSAIIALGVNYWPTGGSNVWLSTGNFHIWYPQQQTPATEWETEIDRLYNLGRVTLDKEKAKEIYDQYQRILLTELPVMYIVHPFSFLGIRKKWENVFYDNLRGLQLTYLYLK